jgi:ABC-type bacteriocin/lantibiotic exporter with double-glycine peptidase domain
MDSVINPTASKPSHMQTFIHRTAIFACVMLSSSVIAQSGNRPRQYFISQEKDQTNLHAPKNNGDCGPTSLAMAARHFGKIPAGFSVAPNDVERLISHIRELMTNMDNHKQATHPADIVRGAERLGMKAHELKPKTMEVLDQELKHGGLVIAGGNPCAPGAFGPAHGYTKNGGHWVVVTKKTNDGYYFINDPAGLSSRRHKESGSYKVNYKELNCFINSSEGATVSITRN